MHTVQLELTQSNLQKEKEAALSELQASLREKWAQESAMLQTRQQFELEKFREQGREQIRKQETQTELKQKLAIGETEKHQTIIHTVIRVVTVSIVFPVNRHVTTTFPLLLVGV